MEKEFEENVAVTGRVMGACSSHQLENNESTEKRLRYRKGFYIWKRKGSNKKAFHDQPRLAPEKPERQASLRTRDGPFAGERKQTIENKDKFVIESFPASPYNVRSRYSLSRDKNQNETIEKFGVNTFSVDKVKRKQKSLDVISVEKAKVEEIQAELETDKPPSVFIQNHVGEQQHVNNQDVPQEQNRDKLEDDSTRSDSVAQPEPQSQIKLEETGKQWKKSKDSPSQDEISKTIETDDFINESTTKNELEEKIETNLDDLQESSKKLDIVVQPDSDTVIELKNKHEEEAQVDENDLIETENKVVSKIELVEKVKKPVKKLSDFKLFIFDKYAERLAGRIQDNAMTGLEGDSLYDDDTEYINNIKDSILPENEKAQVTNENDYANAKNSDELDEFVNGFVESVLKKCVEKSIGNELNEIAIQQDLVDGKEEMVISKDENLGLKKPDKYDRPLSGYAEKLADFLNDDDFDEMTESEDESCEEEDEEEMDDDDEEEEEDDEETEDDETDEEDELDTETSQLLENEMIIQNLHSETIIQETVKSPDNHKPKQTDTSTNIECEAEPVDVNSNKIDSEILIDSSHDNESSQLDKSNSNKDNNIEIQSDVTTENTNGENTEGKVKKTLPATSVVLRKRQNKIRRTRGERPKSLYEQDILNKFLKEELNNTQASEDEIEDENSQEAKPISERANLLEKKIPLLQRSNSLPSESSLDDLYGCYSTRSPSNSKPPVLGKAVVIDPGCGALKAGISGEMRPTCYCPSVIGIPRRFSQDVSKMKKGYFVGDEAWTSAGMLQIEHPIKQEITSWSDVSNIYEYIFDEALEINSNEHPVLLTELSLTSSKNREKITEIMFEKFNVPSFYLANQSCLALYSQGLTSGLSFSSGFYHTQATPIYEGHALPHGTTQLDIGGSQITDFLGRSIMGTQGVVFNTSSEKLILNSMKQDLCYVAVDPKSEEEKYKNTPSMYQQFDLPDGQQINIGVERFIAPEVMFDPSMIGIRSQSNVVDLIYDSISRIDVDLKSTMLDNVIMSGGNSKLQGFQERMRSETRNHSGGKINFQNVDDPLLSTWIGGSVLASIQGYRDQWISLESYAEHGSHLVHAMCF